MPRKTPKRKPKTAPRTAAIGSSSSAPQHILDKHTDHAVKAKRGNKVKVRKS